jgi:hypothetical protein
MHAKYVINSDSMEVFHINNVTQEGSLYRHGNHYFESNLVFGNIWDAYAKLADMLEDRSRQVRAEAEEYRRRASMLGEQVYYVSEDCEPRMCRISSSASVTSEAVEARVEEDNDLVRENWGCFHLDKRRAYSQYLEVLRLKMNRRRNEATAAQADFNAIDAEMRRIFGLGYTSDTFTLAKKDA